MNVNKIFTESTTVAIFIVLLIGLLNYKRLSTELRYIFYFVAIGGFFELFNDFYKANIAKNTMPVGHLYITISIILLGFFYLRILKGFANKWLIHGLLVAFSVYAIVNPIFIQSVLLFPNYLGAVGALIMVVFSILFFSRILVEAKIEKLSREPLVWINAAILFFYSGSFFFYILFNLAVQRSLGFIIFTTRSYAILNVAFYLILGVSFLKAKKYQI